MRDKAGNTALHRAARLGARDSIKALLASGADINARNKAGKTPSDDLNIMGMDEFLKALGGKTGKELDAGSGAKR